MLILSRRLGESIVIGENVSVTIVGVTGNQIRIGIDAPRDVAVHREEIHKKIAKGEGHSAKRQGHKDDHQHNARPKAYTQQRIVNR